MLLYTEDQGQTWEQGGPFIVDKTARIERMKSGDIFVVYGKRSDVPS